MCFYSFKFFFSGQKSLKHKCAFEIYSLFFSFVKELLILRERASEIKLKGMKNTGIWQ